MESSCSRDGAPGVKTFDMIIILGKGGNGDFVFLVEQTKDGRFPKNGLLLTVLNKQERKMEYLQQKKDWGAL